MAQEFNENEYMEKLRALRNNLRKGRYTTDGKDVYSEIQELEWIYHLDRSDSDINVGLIDNADIAPYPIILPRCTEPDAFENWEDYIEAEIEFKKFLRQEGIIYKESSLPDKNYSNITINEIKKRISRLEKLVRGLEDVSNLKTQPHSS